MNVPVSDLMQTPLGSERRRAVALSVICVSPHESCPLFSLGN